MKVAICFWGLTRSLSHTLSSIQSCLFQPLLDAGITYSIFLHTYTLYRPYSNPRAGETEIQLQNTAWQKLQPTNSVIENQDRVDEQLHLEQYRTKGDPWGNEPVGYTHPFATLNNHIRALWSLHQVTTLWESSGETFDTIIYARPDVLYRTPLNVDWIRSLGEKVCLMPSFQCIQECNDRFAIGTPSVMKTVGHRFLGALEYSKRFRLHSEEYLAYTLASHGISARHIQFPFRRIRADGTVASGDRSL